MPLCAELLTLVVAWLVVAILPSLAVFGGAGWLAWRHDRRAASFVGVALAAAACLGSAFLFRGDPEGVWVTLAFVPLLLAHAWAVARPTRAARGIALAAAALPPMGLLAFVLLEVGSTAACHTV